MNPIKIDLRDLTDAHVEQALNRRGQCLYTAPCIIGTLIPEDQRERLDNFDLSLERVPHMQPKIEELVAAGHIVMPEGQTELATKLQTAFDETGEYDFIDDEFADDGPADFLDTLAEVRSKLQ